MKFGRETKKVKMIGLTAYQYALLWDPGNNTTDRSGCSHRIEGIGNDGQ